jgi:hypothetical protein
MHDEVVFIRPSFSGFAKPKFEVDAIAGRVVDVRVRWLDKLGQDWALRVEEERKSILVP